MRDISKEFYALFKKGATPIERIGLALAYARKIDAEDKLGQLSMDYYYSTPTDPAKLSGLAIFKFIDNAHDAAESEDCIALLKIALKCKIVLKATDDTLKEGDLTFSQLFHDDFMNIIRKGRWKTALLIAQSMLAFKSEFEKSGAAKTHILKLVGEVLANTTLIDSYPGEESDGYLPQQLLDTLKSIFGTHYIYKGKDGTDNTYASHIALGRNPSDSNGYYKMLARMDSVSTTQAIYVYTPEGASPLEILIARRSWNAIAAVTTAEYFPANVRGDSRFDAYFTKIFLKLTAALKTASEAPFREDILTAIKNLINQGLFTPDVYSECFFNLKDPTVFRYLMEENTEKMILDNLIRVSGVDMSLIQYRELDKSLREVLLDKKYKASCLLAAKGKVDELLQAVYENPELLTVTQDGLTPFEIALATKNILVAQKILTLALARPDWLNLKTEETPPRMLSAVIMSAMATHILKNKKLDEGLSPSLRSLMNAICSNSSSSPESFEASKIDILKIAVFTKHEELVTALMPRCIATIFDPEQTDAKTHQRAAITHYLLSPESFELFSRNYLTEFAALAPATQEEQLTKLEAYLTTEQKENPENSLFFLFNFLVKLGESHLINENRLMRLFAAGLKGLRHSYVNFESTPAWYTLIANNTENLNPYFYLLEYGFELTKTNAECKAIFEKILLLDKGPDESSFLAHLLKIGDTDYLVRYFELLKGIEAQPADFQAAFAYKAPAIASANAALNPIDVLATQALTHPEILDLCIPYLSLESLDTLIASLNSAEPSKEKTATLAKLTEACTRESHRNLTQLGVKAEQALIQLQSAYSKLSVKESGFLTSVKPSALNSGKEELSRSLETLRRVLSEARAELTSVNASLKITEDEAAGASIATASMDSGAASLASDLSPTVKIDESLAEINGHLKHAKDLTSSINRDIEYTSTRLCASIAKRNQLRTELKTAKAAAGISAIEAKLLAAETEVETLREELRILESFQKQSFLSMRPIYARAISLIGKVSEKLIAEYDAAIRNIEDRSKGEASAKASSAATTAASAGPASSTVASPTTSWGLHSLWLRASSASNRAAAGAGAGAGAGTTAPAIIGSLNG